MKLSRRLSNFILDWTIANDENEEELFGPGEALPRLIYDLYSDNIISFNIESYFDEALGGWYVQVFVPFPRLMTNIPDADPVVGHLVFQEGIPDDIQLGNISSVRGLIQALLRLESIASEVIEGYGLSPVRGRYR